MKLEGDYKFDAPVEEVWSALLDPQVLAAVMPGCEKLELVEGQYVGELNIKVGPVQGKFTGKVDLKDMVAPSSYAMVVDGRGAPGFVKANAVVKLAPDGEGTKMSYDADAQVGGKIASVGQRLLEASSRAIVKQSLEGLHENIKIRAEAYRKAREAAAAAAAAEAAASASQPAPEATESPAGESTPPRAPAPAPLVAVPMPQVELKQASAADFAASVAKEVTRSLIPRPVLYVAIAAAVALVAWLALRG